MADVRIKAARGEEEMVLFARIMASEPGTNIVYHHGHIGECSRAMLRAAEKAEKAGLVFLFRRASKDDGKVGFVRKWDYIAKVRSAPKSRGKGGRV